MRRLAFLLSVILAMPSAAFAQQPAAEEGIDPTRLGVSVDRIRRVLRQQESRETVSGTPMRLEYRIEVLGQAPPIDLFPEDFSLTLGPVPHSAPTHREHIEYVTPQEFRAPVVPIYGLAVWAAQKLYERSKKQQCEDELREYRALVMQGVAVAAPRCSQ